MKKMNMLVALFVVLLCSSFTLGKGKGKSKKLAEQFAAKEALELMGIK